MFLYNYRSIRCPWFAGGCLSCVQCLEW